MYKTIGVCLVALGGLATTAAAADVKKLTPEEVAKAEKAVKTYLEQQKAEGGFLQQIKDERLEKLFPRQVFYTLLFRQYPVGRVPPKGFAVSNILAVDADGKVARFTAVSKDMLDYFNAGLPGLKTDNHAKDIARAWVRLVEEFSQDGFYKFVLADDATKVTAEGPMKKVTAKVVASAGGNGEVNVVLLVDENGKITKVDGNVNLKPGPRPICHATKLLDADPLVRRIVEQDLLIMGTAAKYYLDEQRAKASPELQAAIDRIWQRILDGDKASSKY